MSSSGEATTRVASETGNRLPTTARVWSSSFCAAGRRSMREASTPRTVGGTFTSLIGFTSLTVPLRERTPCSKRAWTISSMKNGLPSVRSAMRFVSGCSSGASPSSAVSIWARLRSPADRAAAGCSSSCCPIRA